MACAQARSRQRSALFGIEETAAAYAIGIEITVRELAEGLRELHARLHAHRLLRCARDPRAEQRLHRAPQDVLLRAALDLEPAGNSERELRDRAIQVRRGVLDRIGLQRSLDASKRAARRLLS